jgi:SMC interacting uncharacterized protein involved in chromosome segregation
MSLRGKLNEIIIAGNISDLEKIKLECENKIYSACRKWQIIREEYVTKLNEFKSKKSDYDKRIKVIEESLAKYDNEIKAAKSSLEIEKGKLETCKINENNIAKLEDERKKLYEILIKNKAEKVELEKLIGDFEAAIKAVDAEGSQNEREARSKYKEACIEIDKAKDFLGMQPY